MKTVFLCIILVVFYEAYSDCKKWNYTYDNVGNRITRTFLTTSCRMKNPNNIDSIINQSNRDSLLYVDTVQKNIYKRSNVCSVYPNPCKNFFIVKFNEFVSNAQISILDYNGNLLLQDNVEGQLLTIDIGIESAGLYIVIIKLSDGTVFSEKVVKL